MIIVVHNGTHATEVLDAQFNTLEIELQQAHITPQLFEIAALYPDQFVCWCRQEVKANINIEGFKNTFHHKRVMASYSPRQTHYFDEALGFVERSYFFKMNTTKRYPTWRMSSVIGGIHAKVLLIVSKRFKTKMSFDYCLISIAKLAMSQGLFCYSEPQLLTTSVKEAISIDKASTTELFKFVKQHYKWIWVYFLALAYLIYEKKLLLFPLMKSLFYKQQSIHFNLETITIKSAKSTPEHATVDVIIPTIGRKQYLYDVLVDLSKQTLLPTNVIIVEQNPLPHSISELDYLTTQDWPFKIKHTFTHQAGVCNARNIALSQVESEWTLLGDDDNRFENHLIEQLLKAVNTHGVNVGTTVYLQPNETQTYLKTTQTDIFGSGNTMIHSSLISKAKFNTKYEFNYGEDSEFGMQLRYLGEDVIYFSDIKITHLKAPIGGYRTKVKQLWEDEAIQPKPSPTIYLLQSTYFTPKQLQGYQLLLGLREYKRGHQKNPFKFVKQFKAKWQKSAEWSQKLTPSINA